MNTTTITKESLSVKNVKLHEDMSEETPCFSATLLSDGKPIAEISNRGRGGCNDYRPVNGFKHKDVNFSSDIDCYIMELVENFATVSKYQSKNFVLMKDGKIYTQKFPKPITALKKFGNYQTWLKSGLQHFKNDGYTVLNRNL